MNGLYVQRMPARVYKGVQILGAYAEKTPYAFCMILHYSTYSVQKHVHRGLLCVYFHRPTDRPGDRDRARDLRLYTARQTGWARALLWV